jgi:thiamine-monophosphate kinase
MPTRSSRSSPAIEERSFHAWLARRLAAGREGALPLGDDAAAIEAPPGRVAVLTTDALVEGTHFLADSDPGAIGRAAVAVSLSDAAAKGAQPAALLLDLLLPRATAARWAQAVSLAADRRGREFGAPLVGGDTKPSPVRAVVSTVLAWGRPEALAPRGNAVPDDLIVTTGTVGRGGAAAARLEASGRRGAARYKALADLLDVRPRVREGAALAPLAHAMLDTSDGIAEASRLLADASDVRVVVDAGLLPLDRTVTRLPVHAQWPAAIYGGDYELLAAVPARSLATARTAVRAVGGRLTIIGRVERGRGAWVATGGRVRRMPAGGWQPFGRRGRRGR